jgi:hypothetical protein
MSGYREHSFDPNAYEQPGRPLKPYNWVQWTGVAFVGLGLVGYLAYAADRLGWVSLGLDNASPLIALPLIGVSLINSRRDPGTQVGSEQLEKNRRVLLITVAVLAAVLGAVAVIELSGA